MTTLNRFPKTLSKLALWTFVGLLLSWIQPATAPADPNDRETSVGQRILSPHELSKRGLRPLVSQGVFAVAISPDGSTVAGAEETGEVLLWDRWTGESRGILNTHSDSAITGIVFTDSGQQILAVSKDSSLRAWRIGDSEPIIEVTGHEHAIRSIAVSEGQGLIATAGDETRVFLWETVTGRLSAVLGGHRDFVRDVAFCGDGNTIAAAGRDGRILVWSLHTQRPELVHTLRGHAGPVNSIACAAGGNVLVSGGDDASLKLWDLSSGLQLQSASWHRSAVLEVAIDDERGRVVSAGRDNRLLVWDLESMALQRQLSSGARGINSISISADGAILTGDDRGGISEWDVQSGAHFDVVLPFSIDSVDSTLDRRLETEMSPRRNQILDLIDGFFDWLVPAASAAPLPDPDIGTGGPILVVLSSASVFDNFYPEILRNEGFNAFDVVDVSALDAAVLATHDVVILSDTTISAGQLVALQNWVDAGGNLIAVRPDPQLYSLLGISSAAGTLDEGYLQVDVAVPPGNGIAPETMQFHGTADLYNSVGASAVATLFSDAVTATPHPAITLTAVGTNGGQTAAFAYDFARSIVYTRQGNPAFDLEERDGIAPIRSDDLYYGAAPFDPQPDWVDLDRANIPQADEQQRLLVNLILHMMEDRMPLPRFWFLPRGERAAIIMTGDDHANNGTEPRFNQYLLDSPPGCSVEDWECIRGTSYLYTNTPIDPAVAASFAAQGFEVGVHVNTGCVDYTETSLDSDYIDQFAIFATNFPGLPAPTTQRHHCIAWTGWVTGAKVQVNRGVRLDTNYYYWPASWVDNRPGYMTGSAMPMRFSDLDGTLIDVYQAATQLTDESGQAYPYTIDTLLDWALGPREFFGVLTVNAHTDIDPIIESDTVIASAIARDVPVITSHQMLVWLDGRNSSQFDSIAWNGGDLTFGIAADADANGLQAMVPWSTPAGVVNAISRGGTAIPFTPEAVKGVEYARFDATSGSYTVTYGADSTPPTVVATSPSDGATFASPSTTVSVDFSEGMDIQSLTNSSFELLDGGVPVAASVSYDAFQHRAVLAPTSQLAAGTIYTAVVRSGTTGPRDLSGNPIAAEVQWAFTTTPPPECPCTLWTDQDQPPLPSDPDPNGIELGTRFTSDIDGFVSGVRFYKGAGNTGTHFGNLWSASGELLATGTFVGETSEGWQQLGFADPVPITSNTEYVVSYYAPNGRYATQVNGFTGAGVDTYPLHAPADSSGSPNGVYAYGSSSSFPTDSIDGTNYWVDVIFDTEVTPDTTPPVVISTTPADGTTSVSLSESVVATFNKALDVSTVTPANVELRDSGGALVPSTIGLTGFANEITIDPVGFLSELTTYTVTLRGGSGGLGDLNGNSMTADFVWSFTTADQPVCPCNGWDPIEVPQNPSENDPNAVEVGVKFTSYLDGFVSGIRFYKGVANTGTHVGNLWDESGNLLASATFTGETATGWQQVDFSLPIPVAAGTVYVASYHAPNGGYASDTGYFAAGSSGQWPLVMLADGVSGGNGVYSYGATSSFPTFSATATNYWVDVVFDTENGTAPIVTSVNPPADANNVPTAQVIEASFSEPMDPASITSATFELRDDVGSLVSAAVAYDAPSITAALTPGALLTPGITYTVTVRGGPSGALDLSGVPLASDASWNFTTGTAPACCSVWTPADVPSTPSENDPNAVELGVKFTSDVNGFVSAIRFYKGATNTGTHVGNLWDESGNLLASATFTGETATGWQQVDFAQPVPIAASTVYIASYHAPNGGYAVDGGYFGAGPVDAPPLRLLEDGGPSGGNGVYAYSSTSTFPSGSFGASNYWVDVVLETGATLPPSVVSTSPADGAVNVDENAVVAAVFSKPMDPVSITSATFELRDDVGSLVSAAVNYDAPSSAAALTPGAPLTPGITYTATVRGGPSGALDLSGAPLASDVSWTFTTATAPVCCSVWTPADVPSNPSENDPNAVELGVKFTSDVNGFVSAIRFYKGVGNTGTHVGNLWDAAGNLLSSATFTGETATGWQQVDFAQPVPIAASTVYVASYHAPNGGYAVDGGYFGAGPVDAPPLQLPADGGPSGGNGVYAYSSTSTFPSSSFGASNYWVDVVLETGATLPPTVFSTSPADGAVNVDTIDNVVAVFTEAMDPVSITSATFELRDDAGSLVSAAVAYDAPSTTAVLTPGAPLSPGVTHTATVRGGPSGVLDLSGEPMASDVSWTFTTSTAPVCCTVWRPTDVPSNPSENDPNAVELGVKFTSDVNGFVSSIRFYKGSGNTGTHVGNLWDAAGNLLSSATFTGETATGWQQVDFAQPVPIAASTVYVASYHAPNGGYATDAGYFAAGPVDAPPLQLPADGGPSGGNGVYAYSSTSTFPSSSFGASNYWVDIVFSATSGVLPTVVSVNPVDGSADAPLNAVVEATFSEFMDAATLDTTTFELRDSTGTIVPATVAYDGPSLTANLTSISPLALGETYSALLKSGLILDLDGEALQADYAWSFTAGGAPGCLTPANEIVAENCLLGNPASEWDIVGIGDPTIQGYATAISVNRGESVDFKIDTLAAAYVLDIYRMGYYEGLGARKVATVLPSASLPQIQPPCDEDLSTGNVDCSAWSISASWNVPFDAASGIYFAKVTRTDTSGASHIVFIVRDDASTSEILFQTSDTTWQAYNNYGGNSLYEGNPAGRAYEVSYDRPFYTRQVDNGQDWVFNAEYPMVRWLEANGYDVTYSTGVDSDRLGSLIGNHQMFLSVGHDEYWSADQRANVEAARDAGVHLTFLSGNEVFWKTRWEDGYRTLVCYKETLAGGTIDPATPTWTGTWRDPRFSPPGDGGRPENELTGTIFMVNDGATTSIRVPSDYGRMRFWRNTSVETLSSGSSATLPNGTLGYEWDSDLDNGFRPAGLIRLSATTVLGAPVLQDYGSSYAPGTADHSLTLYRAPSGALVFGAGTVQWSWGLDAEHDRAGTPADVRVQQATVNLFADMGAQAGTLQSGLVAASLSSDFTPPDATVDSPSDGSTVTIGIPVVITGTASDLGGGVVGGVEVSVDGGATWRRADGWESWSYSWTPDVTGITTIRARATDDSANLGAASAAISVTVQ